MMLALCHITFVAKGLQAVLRPKTPDYSAPGENVEINRISLVPTINECIRGLGNENAFHTKERKIYAYKILVEEGDESLYDSNYLYYNDLVKDALLTHEYWYTKIICPQEVLMCEVSSVEKRKYIIIGNNQTKRLKDILFKFNYTEIIPSTECPYLKECKPRLRQNNALKELSWKAVNRAKQLRFMKTEEFKQHAHFRNGVEALLSLLRRKYHVDKIPTRGKNKLVSISDLKLQL